MSVELPPTAGTVVIGGGVMGASTAYHLALAGAREVLLVERSAHLEEAATSRCAGGVRYQFATPVNIELSKVSLPMLERFREELGLDPQYRQIGYLFALTRPEDVERFQASVELQHRLGVETEWLDGDELRRRLSLMRFDDALAGTFHHKDGLADPSSVNQGYLNGARRHGVRIAMETEVQSIELAGGRVVAVATTRGRVACGQVVNAAGPWAADVSRLVGLELPIRPIRRQMVTTTPIPELRSDFPFVIDFARALYFHPEGEGLLTGMSNPDQPAGYDQTIDEAWEVTALEAAMQRMPILERAGRLAGWAGLYEVTPDAHPVFGPTEIDGFWIVAGFSGHGFMHGPVAGKLMAEFLTDGRAHTVDVSALDLARFAEGREIREYNVI